MQPKISIKNFSKRFGTQLAVDNLSLDVWQRDVFAFLGSNGSGKTTTFRSLLGIYTADSGELLIDGVKYDQSQSSKIGYLPEERGIYTKEKLNDVFKFFAELRNIKSTESQKLIDDYLKKVDLFEHKDKKISALSSGMQQKVQIGLTIIHSPEILILDEPFKGLDPLNRQLFLDIFEELREKGTTIMYSTHAVDEVQKLANRLVMIKEGKRVLYGNIDEIRDSFGTKNIILRFKGKLPTNDSMYTARIEHNFAEITPKSKTTPAEIIKFLIESGLEVEEFKVDKPSLNDIFIKTAKSES